MERLAPVGDVYQAGTLSGNPLATAAGLSVLRRLRDPRVYDELEQRRAGSRTGSAPFGRVQRVGAMLTLFCGDEPVRDFDDAPARDTDRYGALFRSLLDRRRLRRAVAVRGDVRLARARRRRRSTGRSRPSASFFASMTAASGTTLADGRAGGEPALGGGAAAAAEQELRAGLLAARPSERFALGVETIYEGYLLHYGRPRLFAPADARRRAAARRLPLRARPRPRRASRRRRRGRRPRRADLALRPAAARRTRPGDGAAWAATAALRRGRAGSRTRALRSATSGDPEPLLALARGRGGRRCGRARARAHAPPRGLESGAMLALADRSLARRRRRGQEHRALDARRRPLFLGVIAIGAALHYLAHKRKRRKSGRAVGRDRVARLRSRSRRLDHGHRMVTATRVGS